MSVEIAAADVAGIEVVNAEKLRHKLEHDRRVQVDRYIRQHACKFCKDGWNGCSNDKCHRAHKAAYRYAEAHFTSG